MRNWMLATASLGAAAVGIALFLAALDVGDTSLARSPMSLFSWRYR